MVVARSVLLYVVVCIGADTVVSATVYLNTWVGSNIPWFIVPSLALSLGVLRRSRRWYEPLSSVRPPSTAMSVFASVFLAAAIAAASLLSMALASGDALIHGRVALPGDRYHTTAAIQAGVSLTVPVMAAFYEEAGVRAALQLRLQHVIGPRSAEILAGFAFLVLHGFVIGKSPWQLPALAFMAIVNGRLAAVTQGLRCSVLSHGLSNGIVIVTCVVLRGMNR